MARNDWIVAIRSALEAQPVTPSGRAGETPVGNITERITRIDPTSAEMLAICSALAEVVRSSPKDNPRWWRDLTNLILFANVPAKDVLSDVFYTDQIHEPEIRSIIMLALVNLGHRFTPRELGNEIEVKRLYPLQWTECAVASGEVDSAFHGLSGLLRTGAVTTRDISSRLPLWYRKQGDTLLRYASEWLEIVPPYEDRDVLLSFFRNIGIPNVKQRVEDAGMTVEATTQRIERDRDFLSDLKEHRRLNGNEFPVA